MRCAYRRTLLLAVAAFALAVGPDAAQAGPKDKRLDIYWIDVEGGAATLIVTPAGQSVLIDAGNPGRRDADRIVRTLAEAGLKQIDHLIVTHYHVDHFGGAANLAELAPIAHLHDNGQFEGMPENPGKAYWNLKCGKRSTIDPGDKLELTQLDGRDATPLSIMCLGTRQKFVDPPRDGAKPDKPSDANDGKGSDKDAAAKNDAVCALHKLKNRDGSDNANSVVMLLSFGKFRFFDAGDLTWNMEHKLVCPANLVGKVDVYQVTHHGLAQSNNPAVVASLAPTVTVMNNGTTKGCEPDTFATLKSAMSLKSAAPLKAMYQMHKNLRADGHANNAPDEYIANLEKNCKGNFIKLSVDPTGSEYTVGIPANRHTATYRTK